MTRTLVLMRHGERLERNNKHQDELSKCGIGEVRSTAQQLLNGDVVPSVIKCGPSNRTQQTAREVQALYKAAGHDIVVRVDERLDTNPNLPFDSPIFAQNVSEMASELSETDTALAITHEDVLVTSLDWLTIAEDRESSTYRLAKKAYTGFAAILKTDETWAAAARPEAFSFYTIVVPRSNCD